MTHFKIRHAFALAALVAIVGAMVLFALGSANAGAMTVSMHRTPQMTHTPMASVTPRASMTHTPMTSRTPQRTHTPMASVTPHVSATPMMTMTH